MFGSCRIDMQLLVGVLRQPRELHDDVYQFNVSSKALDPCMQRNRPESQEYEANLSSFYAAFDLPCLILTQEFLHCLQSCEDVADELPSRTTCASGRGWQALAHTEL